MNSPTAAELETVTLRKSLRSETPVLAFIALTFVAATIVVFAYPETNQILTLGSMFGRPIRMALPMLGLLPLVGVAVLSHRLMDCKYVISGDHVTCVEGLWSLRSKSTKVRFNDARGIEMDSSLLGRILNYGDLEISSSNEEITVSFRGVKDPMHWRQAIEDRRTAQQKHADSPGGSAAA